MSNEPEMIDTLMEFRQMLFFAMSRFAKPNQLIAIESRLNMEMTA